MMMMSVEAEVRLAFACFIRDIGAIMDDCHFFTVQGDCSSSLCLLTMLTPDLYSAMLVAANLVQQKKNRVECSPAVWVDFLESHNLSNIFLKNLLEYPLK